MIAGAYIVGILMGIILDQLLMRWLASLAE